MAQRLMSGAVLAVVALIASRASAQEVIPPPPAQTTTSSPAPAERPVQVTADKDGFAVRAADGSFQLKLRGYVQSDGRFVDAGAAQRDVDSFLLRRVRPVLEVTTFKRFELRLMPDFGEGRVVLQDAYADIRFGRTLRVRTGKFKAPFGLERLASATELQFVERGAPTLLAPNRDIGVMLMGEMGRTIGYQAAFVNGVPNGGSADFDDNGGKDVVARVFAYPFRHTGPAALRGLGIGGAASGGSEAGTRSTPGLPTFRTAGSQTLFRYRNDGSEAGTVVASGRRLRRSAQAVYYAGAVGVVAELTDAEERLKRGAVSSRVNSRAWLMSTALVLTGERAASRVTPRHDFDPGAGDWGALELTARLTGLDIDADVFPFLADPAVSARRSRESAVGVNWYLNRAVKLSTSFHHTTFTGGASGADRPTERVVLSRLQFAF